MREFATRSNSDKEQGDVSQKECDDDTMTHRHARKDDSRRQYLGCEVSQVVKMIKKWR